MSTLRVKLYDYRDKERVVSEAIGSVEQEREEAPLEREEDV